MESVDDTVWRMRRMEENTDRNLKCIALLIACVQDDACNSNLPLLRGELQNITSKQTYNL